jgi:hypothetical protein
MKRLAFSTWILAVTAVAFGQGTVVFNNRVSGRLISYVYYNPGVYWMMRGNGTAETPAGTTDWAGYSRVSGPDWMAALLAANGAGQSESSLTFGASPTTTTFRTGAAAGNVAGTTATLNNVPPDAAAATLEVFVWNSAGNGITDPTAAMNAWKAGTVIGGLSGAFTVTEIGGWVNTPPVLTGWQSFNIIVPEPSGTVLASLGLFYLLLERRFRFVR